MRRVPMGMGRYLRRADLFALLSLVLVPLAVSGQSFRLAGVQISGSQRLPKEEVAAASGLTIGEPVTLEDLQAAADRLAGMDLFEYVSYQYETNPGTISVTFIVEESTKFRPCKFDNFVWLSQEELNQRLEGEIPLYKGEAPPGGFLPEEIKRVMGQILAERGIEARVTHFAPMKAEGGINLFRVEGVAIPVASLNFEGAAKVDKKELQKASQSLLAQDFSRSFLEGFIQNTLVPLYRARGYLKAQFQQPQVDYLGEIEGTYPVRVILPVEEGDPYRVQDIRWQGATLFPADELQKHVSLRAGQIADTVRLEEDLRKLRDEEYGGRGYILAETKVGVDANDDTKEAVLTVNITEGDLYRYQALVIRGLPDKTTTDLQRRWKLQPGEPYSTVYLASYMKDVVFPTLQRVRPGGSGANIALDRDDTNKKVSVVLTFH